MRQNERKQSLGIITKMDHVQGADFSDLTRTPTSLLERLREPFEPSSWSRFVAIYSPLIYSWACRVKLQEQDALDLVQDVFVTLLRVLPTFNYDRDRSFRGWLRTVTLNTWRNDRKRPGNRVLGASADPDLLPGPDEPEAEWEAEYRQHVIGRALAVMRSDFQETTWKACWETVVSGRPAAQVAAELGLSVGAVYAAKVRVLNRLREELQGLLD
jgi:RNA polymerase sigma-70 factor (ECF subfamily)